MTSALVSPLTLTERCRLVAMVDEAMTSFGMPAYSTLQADLALAHVGFHAAVRERAIGLASDENRRLRIALAVTLQDVLAVQSLLAEGNRREAELAIHAMLPELRLAAHKHKPTALPAGVASLEEARERRDGAL